MHVSPSGTPHHPGLRGAFWTLPFSPRNAPAYTPHPRGPGHLVTDATHIKGYVDLFATLQGAALPTDTSLRLPDHTIDQAAQTPAITTGNTGVTAEAAAPYAFDIAARAAAD